MEALLLDMKSELGEMKGALMELKMENALLRKEILGIGTSACSNEERNNGILETKTLIVRKVVDEIHFGIKTMKTQTENDNGVQYKNFEQETLHPKLLNSTVKNDQEANPSFWEDSQDRYPVVEIEHKTIEEERAWMKSRFSEERAKVRDPGDGASLSRIVVGAVSTILGLKAKASCVLKLSNHLNSDLKALQEYVPFETEKIESAIGIVGGNTCETFAYYGNTYQTGFVLSFRISTDLRLTVSCWCHSNGRVNLSLGFTPERIPTDRGLLRMLDGFQPVPDVCTSGACFYGGPLEYFVNHGKLLARGHMSPGPHSVVHVDILEVDVPQSVSNPTFPNNSVDRTNGAGTQLSKMRPILEGSSRRRHEISFEALLRSAGIPDTPNSQAVLVQLTNCLNVSLKNRGKFLGDCERPKAFPATVLPFTWEKFLLSSNKVVQAMFLYEIDSTDLGFVIAFRVRENVNEFSASFVPLPAVTCQSTFDSSMHPGQWKTHLYRKFANAQDGEQEIQMRNIRARASMWDEAKSYLEIRIFAV